MPKNKGGNKTKRGKNRRPPRELQLRENGQYYAVVDGNLGNGRVLLKIIKNDKQFIQGQGIIRGKLKKCCFLTGEMVLISEREFSTDVYDICAKYTQDHVQQLLSSGEISATNPVFGSSDIMFVKSTDEYDFDETIENIDTENKVCNIGDEDEDEDEDEDNKEGSQNVEPQKISGVVKRKLEMIASKGNTGEHKRALISVQRNNRGIEQQQNLSQQDIDDI